MVSLGNKEMTDRQQLGHDGGADETIPPQSFDHAGCERLLLLVMVENYRAILGTHIMPLTVQGSRIVNGKKYGQQRFDIDFHRVEFNLHDFRVAAGKAGGEGEFRPLGSNRSVTVDVSASCAIANVRYLRKIRQAAEVEIDSFATLAAFELIERQLPDAGKNQVVALLDVGANLMKLSVMRNGHQVYSREQAFGGSQLTLDISRHYGMSLDDAELAKRAGNLPEGYEAELLAPFMENLALEVSRALQFFFTSTQFNQVDHIVLAGSGQCLGLGT
mgnify:CR=1 FL=1